jgi:hypothetical protein
MHNKVWSSCQKDYKLKDSQNLDTELDQIYKFVLANWSHNIPPKSKIEMPLA